MGRCGGLCGILGRVRRVSRGLPYISENIHIQCSAPRHAYTRVVVFIRSPNCDRAVEAACLTEGKSDLEIYSSWVVAHLA